MNPKRYIFYCL